MFRRRTDHHHFKQLFNSDRVKTITRFIEDQKLRFPGKRKQECQFSTHSFRERFDLSVRRQLIAS